MTCKEFWHCTPRKLDALSDLHIQMNSPKGKKSVHTIDGVPVRKIPNAKRADGSVGAPNAFVDQIKLP